MEFTRWTYGILVGACLNLPAGHIGFLWVHAWIYPLDILDSCGCMLDTHAQTDHFWYVIFKVTINSNGNAKWRFIYSMLSMAKMKVFWEWFKDRKQFDSDISIQFVFSFFLKLNFWNFVNFFPPKMLFFTIFFCVYFEQVWPGPCIIKLITAVIYGFRNKLVFLPKH